MALTVCSDVSPADWLVASDLSWQRLVTFGPEGFAAYARIRFIPDPVREGQQEYEADLNSTPDEVAQWRSLLRLLAVCTVDPHHCYFALWEGWGFPQAARSWPRFAVPRDADVPARSYFLFSGSLLEAAIWDGGNPALAGIWGRPEFSGGGAPAFVWPPDHTWCVAADTDPHWAGVGACAQLIERLRGDPGLDAVEADPVEEQPAYR